MSVSTLLFDNNYEVHGKQLIITGVDQFGNYIAPIITPSPILCANVYVHRAEIADNAAGNVTSNVLTILNDPTVNYVLTGVTTNTCSWQPGPNSINGLSINPNDIIVSGQITSNVTTGTAPFVVNSTTQVTNMNSEFSGTSDVTLALKSLTTTVDVSSATAPTTGQVLTATSGTSAGWSTPSSSFASLSLTNTTNQLTLGTTNTVTISSTAPSASRTATLADPGGNYNIPTSRGGALDLTNASASNYILQGASSSTATWTNPGSLTGGYYFVQKASVDLTSADILALNTTRVQVLGSLGSNIAAIGLGWMIEYKYNSIQYAGGGNMILTYGTSLVNVITSTSITSTVFTANAFSTFAIGTVGSPIIRSSVADDNAGIQLAMVSGGAAFTTGNGTARVTIWYIPVTQFV